MILTNFFTSVSPNSDPLPPPDTTRASSHDFVPAEFIIPLEVIEKQLKSVNLSKAVGPDDLPNWFIRDFADIIAGPVCAICNSSIREGYTRCLWLKANICTPPKVTSVSDIKKDVRPIALTPNLSKILEYHPVQHMWRVCPNVDPTQFGAVKNSSTTHALLQILSIIYKGLDDSKNFARLLLVYFSKAFDHIHHPTLINKLTHNGIPDIISTW